MRLENRAKLTVGLITLSYSAIYSKGGRGRYTLAPQYIAEQDVRRKLHAELDKHIRLDNYQTDMDMGSDEARVTAQIDLPYIYDKEMERKDEQLTTVLRDLNRVELDLARMKRKGILSLINERLDLDTKLMIGWIYTMLQLLVIVVI